MRHNEQNLGFRSTSKQLITVCAFSLLEVLLAMSVFSIAAISLAGALNMIGVTVADSQDDAAIREQLRSRLVERSRSPVLEQLEEETLPDGQYITYKTVVERLDLNNIDGVSLQGLYQITVTAIRKTPGLREEVIDSAQTFSYPGLFK